MICLILWWLHLHSKDQVNQLHLLLLYAVIIVAKLFERTYYTCKTFHCIRWQAGRQASRQLFMNSKRVYTASLEGRVSWINHQLRSHFMCPKSVGLQQTGDLDQYLTTLSFPNLKLRLDVTCSEECHPLSFPIVCTHTLQLLVDCHDNIISQKQLFS